jgi:hypothetical protein
MKVARILTAAALVLTAGACGGDGTGPGDGDNSLEASIAGEPGFDPQPAFIGGSYINNNLSIQASHTVGGKTVTIQINLPGITSEGPVLLNQNVAGQFAQVSVLQNNQLSLWTTNVAPGNGTVDVDVLTATRAAGTFTFTGQAAPGNPATGTKAVTFGSFDIEF